MNLPAKLSDLIDVLLMDSPEHVTRFDRQTGQIVRVERSILSAVEEGAEDSLTHAPDWQKAEVEVARALCEDAGERFLHPPDKFDFNEYRQMERFIGTLSDQEAADQLWRAIKGKGAFRYFKDTLHRLGIQEEWYRYRDEAMKEFVIGWAEANNVLYEDNTAGKRF
jgi:Uncharacterised protein family (UPF0158)